MLPPSLVKSEPHSEHASRNIDVSLTSNSGVKIEKNPRGQILVRGRIFDDKKPKTFNQPWTPEEQRRLQELLIEFPSEDVEMERWKKIAAALGNRTAIQVQSRTQKYFQKLQKAGLPIPGKQHSRTRYRYMGGGKGSRSTANHTNPWGGKRVLSFQPWYRLLSK